MYYVGSVYICKWYMYLLLAPFLWRTLINHGQGIQVSYHLAPTLLTSFTFHPTTLPRCLFPSHWPSRILFSSWVLSTHPPPPSKGCSPCLDHFPFFSWLTPIHTSTLSSTAASPGNLPWPRNVKPIWHELSKLPTPFLHTGKLRLQSSPHGSSTRQELWLVLLIFLIIIWRSTMIGT